MYILAASYCSCSVSFCRERTTNYTIFCFITKMFHKNPRLIFVQNLKTMPASVASLRMVTPGAEFRGVTLHRSYFKECIVAVADPENFGGGDNKNFKHKTSQSSEIQRFFSPKIRWSPNKKNKKRSSPKLRLIFRPKSGIQTFFPPKIRWSPKKQKKKKKKVFTEIETDFSAEIVRFRLGGGMHPPLNPPLYSRVIYINV